MLKHLITEDIATIKNITQDTKRISSALKNLFEASTQLVRSHNYYTRTDTKLSKLAITISDHIECVDRFGIPHLKWPVWFIEPLDRIKHLGEMWTVDWIDTSPTCSGYVIIHLSLTQSVLITP